VVFYLDLYRTADGGLDWGKIVAIWDGGLAIYGTVIAGFLVAVVYTRVKKLKLGAMTDLCVMGLLMGQCIGRWGNFVNREAYGAATTLPWRMKLWVSAYSSIEVHPTFLYESLWNLAGLLLVLFIITKGRRFDGENTWFYFLWYGLGRTWVEGLRADSLYLFDWTFLGEPIRVSQALSIVLAAAAAVVLFYHIKLRPHDPADLLVNQVAAKAAAAQAAADETQAAADAAQETTDEAAETTDETVEMAESEAPEAPKTEEEDAEDGSADGR
jgi:phosphatidylglycerol:prolipoprotein diacylglycerol transferase